MPLRIYPRDPQRAAAFHTEVFGWSLPATPVVVNGRLYVTDGRIMDVLAV